MMNTFGTQDLQAIVKRADLSKPLFAIPMTPLHSAGFIQYKAHSDEPVEVQCRVVEGRYKVADGYKIELLADNDQLYGKESFYLSDLAIMVNQGSAKVLQ